MNVLGIATAMLGMGQANAQSKNKMELNQTPDMGYQAPRWNQSSPIYMPTRSQKIKSKIRARQRADS